MISLFWTLMTTLFLFQPALLGPPPEFDAKFHDPEM